MKAKLLQNIKMFIVGAILLIISFTYIKGHPGEWNSFVPSLQMLYYKGEVFFYKILGKDAKSLELTSAEQGQIDKLAIVTVALAKNKDNKENKIAQVTAGQVPNIDEGWEKSL